MSASPDGSAVSLGLPASTPSAGSTMQALLERPKADAAHFDRLHQADPDPWDVRTEWYERRKRALALAMLPRERYGLAFEPGCSIGVTTRELARRCDRLIAADVSHAALMQARSTVGAADARRVQFERWEVPQQWPSEKLDLIVISELGYYLSPARLDMLWTRCAASLAPGGHLVLCHARRPFDDAWLDGDEVHERAQQALPLIAAGRYCDDHFRIDVWEAAETAE